MFDIFQVTRSRTRTALLKLFFNDPDQKYYLRELERKLQFPASNLRRELKKLMTSHLFETEKIGNLLFYAVNKNHPIFGDLKKLIFKTIGIEGSLRKILQDFTEIEEAFIFGSFAKEKETSSSDIDLVIIGNINEDKLIEKITPLEKELGREINHHLFSPEEWEEKKKESSFAKAIDEGPKITLIRNGTICAGINKEKINLQRENGLRPSRKADISSPSRYKSSRSKFFH